MYYIYAIYILYCVYIYIYYTYIYIIHYCELTSHWQLMFPHDLAPAVFSKQPVEVSRCSPKWRPRLCSLAT